MRGWYCIDARKKIGSSGGIPKETLLRPQIKARKEILQDCLS